MKIKASPFCWKCTDMKPTRRLWNDDNSHDKIVRLASSTNQRQTSWAICIALLTNTTMTIVKRCNACAGWHVIYVLYWYCAGALPPVFDVPVSLAFGLFCGLVWSSFFPNHWVCLTLMCTCTGNASFHWVPYFCYLLLMSTCFKRAVNSDYKISCILWKESIIL